MRYTEEAIRNRREKKKKIEKILTIIIYILLIPLLIYNSSLIIQAILNPNKTPSFLGIKTYVIVSGSMQPDLDIGDIVVVKEIEEKDLQIEDIISFREGQSVVTHRIIDIETIDNKKQFITKGDNNNSADIQNVNIDSIEGKVFASIPVAGKLALMLQDKIAIIIIVIIFYAYFLRSEKIRNKKKNRRLKRLEYEKGRLVNGK